MVSIGCCTLRRAWKTIIYSMRQASTLILTGGLLLLLSLTALAASSITNIQVSPASPACLCFGQRNEITFDYSTDHAGGVCIWARPFFGGSYVFGSTSHGSPLYPPGSGSDDGYFWFDADDGVTAVDQVRIQMWDDGQSVLLAEVFVDVDLVWGGCYETTPPVLTIPPDYTIECDGSDHPDITGWATATDNCDPNPTVTYSDWYGYGGRCGGGIIFRTWRAVDESGNSVEEDQYLCIACPDVVIVSHSPEWVTSLPATVEISFTFGKCATTADALLQQISPVDWYWSGRTSIISDGLTVNTVTVDLPADAGEGMYKWHTIVGEVTYHRYMLYHPDLEFGVDTIPPTDPTVFSTSHTVGDWSNNSAVAIAVSGATDAVSGVDGFEVAWDHSATWAPSHTKMYEETWSGDTFTATAYVEWYFHLATVDNAGNWTSTVHLGPFKIDTSCPLISDCPGDVTVVAPFGETSAEVDWDAPTAEDLGSGIQTFTSTHHPGDTFEVGTTEVIYTALDNAGNVATCSFDVTVGTIEELVLTGPILLDPGDAPMIGGYPLAAICRVGEPLTGSVMLLKPNGLPLRGRAMILYLNEVELIDGIAHLTLVAHWSVGYDTETRAWSFEILTEDLEPGYYYIYLSFQGEAALTLPFEVTSP